MRKICDLRSMLYLETFQRYDMLALRADSKARQTDFFRESSTCERRKEYEPATKATDSKASHGREEIFGDVQRDKKISCNHSSQRRK